MVSDIIFRIIAFAAITISLSFSEDALLMNPVQLYLDSKNTLGVDEDNSKSYMEHRALSLAHLQNILKIPFDNFTSGNLFGFQINKLTTDDIFSIGAVAMKHGLYETAINWFEAVEEGITNTTLATRSRETDCLASHKQCGDRARNWSRSHRSADTREINALDESEMLERYSVLCRGSDVYEPTNLKCSLERMRGDYAYWKVEHVHDDPRVSVIYDVITDTEISDIKEITKHKLQASRTVHEDGTETVDPFRISANTWLDDPSNLTRELERRIQGITGLNTGTSERESPSEYLQVCSYHAGGLYQPHYDLLGKDVTVPDYIKSSGDRMATFMFYLEDVVMGGATVFPALGLRVSPVKGSAVFWYNLHGDGSIDTRTLHAGCPVVFGRKWVVNKWIHEQGQRCNSRQ